MLRDFIKCTQAENVMYHSSLSPLNIEARAMCYVIMLMFSESRLAYCSKKYTK